MPICTAVRTQLEKKSPEKFKSDFRQVKVSKKQVGRDRAFYSTMAKVVFELIHCLWLLTIHTRTMTTEDWRKVHRLWNLLGRASSWLQIDFSCVRVGYNRTIAGLYRGQWNLSPKKFIDALGDSVHEEYKIFPQIPFIIFPLIYLHSPRDPVIQKWAYFTWFLFITLPRHVSW